MLLSFSTLGCPGWKWQDITATAVDLGYNGIEIRGVGKDISIPSVPEFGGNNLEGTLAKLQRQRLSIPCLDSDCCIYLKDQKEKTDKDVKAYIDLAQKMGVPYVRVFAAEPVPQPMGEVDEIFVRDQAQAYAAYAREHGVVLLLETHGIWANSERLARLMSLIGNEAMGILWDIHHPYRFMGEAPIDTYKNIAPWLSHVHLKDSIWEGDKIKYMMPGHGDVPLKECVQILKENNYNGFYSLEWVKRWDMTLEEPGIVFANFINYMRNI